ncbi:hypothetical protein MTR67_001088 [Solanum verrucosum]|uniref:Replication protein A 70 kDa DNA-binding subunit B/D first OB fold domain-containing protein n=1 Tax=Solanum verrucosum TaxID=315347 RepID=A0AAF0T836_SOLVR|nr:hypothetical protein MTR67_001088 [Solanum verrucosum]
MSYSLLSDLDTTRDDWLVKVRVCRMWEFKNYKRSNEMISDMILIDEKGTLVHPVIWKNKVNRFRANLAKGSVIIIRNFKVAESMGEYRPVQSDVKITFMRITAIQKIKDDTVNIPKNGFQFIRPNIVRSRVNNNTYLSDVVGCLCGIGDLESVGSKWKKRDLHILTDPEDRSGKAKITLWEDYGEGLYPYLFPSESGPYIVIVTTTTVKEFRGEITFATIATTKTYVNLQMDHITSLIQKLATKPIHIQTIESGNGCNIPIEEAMFQNRMTITELLDSDWSYDIEVSTKEFVFKLKLTNFNLKEGLENYTVTKVFVPDEELELQHRSNKEKKEKLKMEAMQKSHVEKAGGSEEHPDDGEGTSNGKTRVYARSFITKRKHFIHLDGESDGDT